MRLSSRKILDHSFSGLGIFSIVLMSLSLLVILVPIFVRGLDAFVFDGTIEFRRLMLEKFERGNQEKFNEEAQLSLKAKQPIFDGIKKFKKELRKMDRFDRKDYKKRFKKFKKELKHLIGPFPDEEKPVMMRAQYGQTRLDRAEVQLKKVLFNKVWDYSGVDKIGVEKYISKKEDFKGTAIVEVIDYIEKNYKEILRPKKTFYWRFLFDKSYDSHFFGGIWPELLGTFYLTLGAMVFAVPMGVIAAIYLIEYAKKGPFISCLRACISTLAGVPSIVFGLFGLAFFINTLHVSKSKSVLAGSLTLAFLILPTIIRASEEAIRSVPKTFKEAALSLGAGKWHTIMTVILPAALPGILTGIVISMGRAAGETAPIIFTAAVSVGRPITFGEAFSQPTPALPWNIYNLCTEHEAVDEIRYVQYGMVLTLVSLVLLLNLTAIILRARISKKLKG